MQSMGDITTRLTMINHMHHYLGWLHGSAKGHPFVCSLQLILAAQRNSKLRICEPRYNKRCHSHIGDEGQWFSLLAVCSVTPKTITKIWSERNRKKNPKKKNLLMLAKTRPEGVLYEADKWVGDGRKQLIQEIQRENGGHNNIIIITFCTLMYNMKKKTQNLNKRVKWCYFYGMFSHLFLHNFFFNFGENKIYLHPMMYWYRIK